MDTRKILNPNKPRVIIVDDDELVLGLLEEVLSDDYEVERAQSGDAALKTLRSASPPFNLALIDVNIPGITGKELLDVCQAEFPSMAVIIMTGAPDFSDAVDTVKHGACDYLAKPIDLDDLLLKANAAISEKENKTGTSNLNDYIGSERKLDSKYKIVRSLGSGNSGVVLLVMKGGKYYAMKILREENNIHQHERRLKRFMREASILSRIDHPGVVKIYEFELGENTPTPYILMEYVDGKPLSKYIRTGELDIMERLDILTKIAQALDYVHTFGVMHRDIKPDNILLDSNNSPKLTDFGISRVSDSSLTMTNDIMGSPMYMAPECFDSSKTASRRSDIFSLGIVAYELLTGTLPFRGDNIYQVAQSVKSALPVRPTKLNDDIPDWAENMLGKMLAKEPSERFQTAGEVAEYLERHLSGKNLMTITSRILRSALHSKEEWS